MERIKKFFNNFFKDIVKKEESPMIRSKNNRLAIVSGPMDTDACKNVLVLGNPAAGRTSMGEVTKQLANQQYQTTVLNIDPAAECTVYDPKLELEVFFKRQARK